jgi:hypothetical protein
MQIVRTSNFLYIHATYALKRERVHMRTFPPSTFVTTFVACRIRYTQYVSTQIRISNHNYNTQVQTCTTRALNALNV